MAYGLVHLVIGWLALQLAVGDPSGSASSNGAIRELAQQPFGLVLVWLVAVGMFLLMCWQFLEAAVGHREHDGVKRVRKRLIVGRARRHLRASSPTPPLSVAIGSGSSGGGTDSTTAKLMDLTGGQLIVGAIGVAIAALGVAQIRKAYTEKFAKKMNVEGLSGTSGTVYVYLAKVGYVAKGVAFGIVGGLFCYAAVTHEPNKSGGLDQALSEVLEQPFGPFLLAAIALGFMAYGLFCFVQARYFDQ